jgi:hypothetical protein
MQLLAGRAEEALACRTGKSGLPGFGIHRYNDSSNGLVPAAGAARGCQIALDSRSLTLLLCRLGAGRVRPAARPVASPTNTGRSLLCARHGA